MVGTNGPKLEAADAGDTDLPFKEANKSVGGRIHSAHMTVPQLAEMLARRLSRPVLDRTGLAGAYRVTMEWAAESKVNKAAKPFDLHRSQARNAPIEVVVIDRVEEIPTAN
jgi:uncharacterized protein (TIGR03435 family)